MPCFAKPRRAASFRDHDDLVVKLAIEWSEGAQTNLAPAALQPPVDAVGKLNSPKRNQMQLNSSVHGKSRTGRRRAWGMRSFPLWTHAVFAKTRMPLS